MCFNKCIVNTKKKDVKMTFSKVNYKTIVELIHKKIVISVSYKNDIQ